MKISLKSINKKLRDLGFRDNFTFAIHQEIRSNDPCVDGIHLTNLGKPMLSKVFVKVNESQYISLFVFSGSCQKLLSIDSVNIYLFSIFFSTDFARWKSVGLLHIAYFAIH